ncbi:MAG: hypothetical protein QW797_01490 [Thermoproteota archaeon]
MSPQVTTIEKMREVDEKIDRIVEKLLEESILTSKQLNALLLYSNSMERKIVKEGYVELNGRKISKGAFFRTLSQGKKNVRKAVITLILMSYVGLMDTNQFSAIMQLTDIMMQVKEQDEDLLNALVEKLKTVVDLRKRVK